MTQNRTLYMVQLSLLTAITIIMAFTPVGYIPMLGFSITLLCIPVALGGILMGPLAGAFLGTVWGITSFMRTFGVGFMPDALGMIILGINPFFTFLVAIPTRIITGWLTGLIFQVTKKSKISKNFSYYITNLSCPLLNSILFLGMLVVLFYQNPQFRSILAEFYPQQIDQMLSNVFVFLWLFVGVNVILEAVTGLILGSIVSRLLVRALRNEKTGIS